MQTTTDDHRIDTVVRILVVEDDEGDERLLVERLQMASSRPGGRRYELTVADTCAGAIESATWRAPDVVLLDLGLPDVRGLDSLRRFQATHPDVPVVVLTGLDDTELAGAAIRAGAEDYLPKSAADMDGIDRAVRYALDRRALRRARDRESEARISAERRFRSLFDEHPDAVVEVDRDGRYRAANARAVELLGPGEPGASFLECFTTADQAFVAELVRHAASGGARSQPATAAPEHGGVRVLLTAIPVGGEEPGGGTGAFLVIQDLSVLSVALNQRQQLAHVVDTVDSGVVVVDAQSWTITFVNDAFAALVGYDRSHLVGAAMKELWPDLKPTQVWSAPRDPSEAMGTVGYRVELDRADGTPLVAGGIARWVPSGGRTLLVASVHDAEARDRREHATQELAAIVRSADLAIVSVDASDRVASWNAGAERLYGVSSEDAIGQRYAEVMGVPDDVRTRQLAKVLQGQVVTATGPRRGAGGGTIQVQSTLSPIIDDAGRVVGASSISRDLSDIHVAEQRLRESEQRFRLLAENASDVIFLRRFEPTTHFEYVSPAVEAILGYRPEDFYADPDLSLRLTHPDDLPVLTAAREQAGEPRAVIVRMRHADGRWRSLDYRLSPAIDQEGRLVGQQGVARDVTDQLEDEARLERYAEELERSNAGLQRANELRDELVSVISHELRTPLTPISGFAALLRDRWSDRLDADQLRIVDVIARNATRMLHLVDQLLNLSRLAAGTLDANPQPVTVGAAIRTLAVDLGYGDGDVTVDGDVEAVATVDGKHLDQMVANLLQNAFRYGRGPVEVTIAACASGVEIRVRDHGDGVPEGFVPKLFEKFAQASTGDTRTAVGLGVGLHLVRELAELNAGRVAYEDAAPGACFVLFLPVGADASGSAAVPRTGRGGLPVPPPRPTAGRRARPSATGPSHRASRELSPATMATATLTREKLANTPDSADVVHEATRLLLHVETADDAVGILLGVIAQFGGDTVWAADAGVDALPVDVSLGTTEPLLPVVDPSSLERMLLESYLPGLVEDARRMVDLHRAAVRVAEPAVPPVERPAASSSPLRVGEAQQDLMTAIAHDMRTPISTLAMIMSLLESEIGSDPDAARLLETATRTADRITRLTHDLLAVAKFGTGSYRFEPRPFRLERVVQQTATAIRQVSGRPIELSVESGLPRAFADEPSQLRVLENLLTNAVKYSPAGAPIHVMLLPHDEGLEVRVHNGGSELEPEELEDLFRPFVRLRRHREAGIEGTGLGLHISQRLIEGQGGRLWVESAPDAGTTFRYTVPADPTEESLA